jgi:hypothetical protein
MKLVILVRLIVGVAPLILHKIQLLQQTVAVVAAEVVGVVVVEQHIPLPIILLPPTKYLIWDQIMVV